MGLLMGIAVCCKSATDSHHKLACDESTAYRAVTVKYLGLTVSPDSNALPKPRGLRNCNGDCRPCCRCFSNSAQAMGRVGKWLPVAGSANVPGWLLACRYECAAHYALCCKQQLLLITQKAATGICGITAVCCVSTSKCAADKAAMLVTWCLSFEMRY